MHVQVISRLPNVKATSKHPEKKYERKPQSSYNAIDVGRPKNQAMGHQQENARGAGPQLPILKHRRLYDKKKILFCMFQCEFYQTIGLTMTRLIYPTKLKPQNVSV